MSSSWLIVLLVVVWLLVLLPMVVKTRQPIRRASQSVAETRVLHRGDGERLQPRRVMTPRVADEGDLDGFEEDLHDDAAETEVTPVSPEASSEAVDEPHHSAKRIDMSAMSSAHNIQATMPLFSDEDLANANAPTEEISLPAEVLAEYGLTVEESATGDPSVCDPSVTDVSAEEYIIEDVAVETTTVETVETLETVDPADTTDTVETAEPAETLSAHDATTPDETSTDESDVDETVLDDAADEAPLDADPAEAEPWDDEAAEYLSESMEDSTPVDMDDVEPLVDDEDKPSMASKLTQLVEGLKARDRHVPEPAPQVTLDAEDIMEAERRRGRGGYDPVAAQAAAAKRYKRRGIIFVVLLTLLIPLLAVAGVIGGLVWLAPVAWAGVIAMYLAALRSQVRLERQIQQRRLEYMRRARSNRAHVEPDEEGYSAGSFHGQYSLVDIDDGDPVFDNLDTVAFMEQYRREHAEEFRYDEGGYLRDKFGRVVIDEEAFHAERAADGNEQDDRWDRHYGHAVPYGAARDYEYGANTGGYAAGSYVVGGDPRRGYRDPAYRSGQYARQDVIDQYERGSYSGGRGRDYWAAAEAAHDVAYFPIPGRDDYRDVV